MADAAKQNRAGAKRCFTRTNKGVKKAINNNLRQVMKQKMIVVLMVLNPKRSITTG